MAAGAVRKANSNRQEGENTSQQKGPQDVLPQGPLSANLGCMGHPGSMKNIYHTGALPFNSAPSFWLTSGEDAPDARWMLESRVAYFSRRIVPMPVYLPRDPP